jgi:hypothetical protein
MKDNEINKYLDYWMEKDANFDEITSNNEYNVEGVEHYDDSGFLRTAISLSQNLVLLFPPYQTGFDYSLFNNNHPFKSN